jgi:N-acylglucosamine 2-epimerase
MIYEQNQELLRTYRYGLLNDTVPFWFPQSVDREHGGFLHSLGRCRRSSQAEKTDAIL